MQTHFQYPALSATLIITRFSPRDCPAASISVKCDEASGEFALNSKPILPVSGTSSCSNEPLAFHLNHHRVDPGGVPSWTAQACYQSILDRVICGGERDGYCRCRSLERESRG